MTETKTSEAIPLVKQGTDDVVAWACGKCRVVTRTKSEAEEHCEPRLCECGKEVRRYRTACDDCIRAGVEARELARFDAAVKVDWGEREEGPVYDPESDEYHADLQDMLDDIPEGGLPRYVWTCGRRRLSIKADDVVDAALDSHHEDSGSDVSMVDELQAMLDVWCATQTIETWEPDYTRAVPLNDICRLCGCTELNACEGGCGWVNEEHTVCTACFERAVVGRTIDPAFDAELRRKLDLPASDADAERGR